MCFRNIFYVYTKRIFTRKVYLLTLIFLIALTVSYQFLPAKNRATDIQVAVLLEDNSEYSSLLKEKLLSGSSVYSFYMCDSVDKLLSDIKSGNAECGYVIPEGFFKDYVTCNLGNEILLYTVPGTTLAQSISETLFAHIYNICSVDILHYAADMPELNDVLSDTMASYMSGNEIFRIKNSQTQSYISRTEPRILSLPVYEVSMILIVFVSLLGLLNYMNDKEREIFIGLSSANNAKLLLASIITAVIPIVLLSLACICVTYSPIGGMVIHLLSLSLLSIAVSFALNYIIRKSTTLTKVLPIIMLFTIAFFFINAYL